MKEGPLNHLWLYEHPYYCNEGCFYARDCHVNYSTWADFFVSEGNADMDMNLVYRWDWLPEKDDDGEPLTDSESRSGKDPYYRGERLLLFFMGQRKAAPRSAEVQVCRADEPDVRAWLTKRWEHMQQLWAPLSERSR
jgi:hypothetical protein